jgi:hypothetical protein
MSVQTVERFFAVDETTHDKTLIALYQPTASIHPCQLAQTINADSAVSSHRAQFLIPVIEIVAIACQDG